jgi:hypothetical protein
MDQGREGAEEASESVSTMVEAKVGKGSVVYGIPGVPVSGDMCGCHHWGAPCIEWMEPGILLSTLPVSKTATPENEPVLVSTVPRGESQVQGDMGPMENHQVEEYKPLGTKAAMWADVGRSQLAF